MQLNIYTDDTYTTIKETRQRDKIKIPYRVGQYVLEAIRTVDLESDQEILDCLLDSEEQITKVVRATFGLVDEDLDHVDAMELAELVQQIMAFVVQKMGKLGAGGNGGNPNAQQPVET